jgi:hypothetical protein
LPAIAVIIRKADLIPGPTLSAVPWFFVEPPYGCITLEYFAVVHWVSGEAYFLDEDRKCHRAILNKIFSTGRYCFLYEGENSSVKKLKG